MSKAAGPLARSIPQPRGVAWCGCGRRSACRVVLYNCYSSAGPRQSYHANVVFRPVTLFFSRSPASCSRGSGRSTPKKKVLGKASVREPRMQNRAQDHDTHHHATWCCGPSLCDGDDETPERHCRRLHATGNYTNAIIRDKCRSDEEGGRRQQPNGVRAKKLWRMVKQRR